jgi:hypothetical protein
MIECKGICLKNGGGKACVEACGCQWEDLSYVCNEVCKDICLKNGGGKACVEACGCKWPGFNQ